LDIYKNKKLISFPPEEGFLDEAKQVAISHQLSLSSPNLCKKKNWWIHLQQKRQKLDSLCRRNDLGINAKVQEEVLLF